MEPVAVNDIIKKVYREKFSVGAQATAKQVKEFAPGAWNDYYKFCVVRNPWTHVVSDYYWRLKVRGNPDISFREFVLRLEDSTRPDPEKIKPPLVSNWDIYTINNEIAVNFVARYENLADDLEYIGATIGVPLDISGIHAKGGVRNQKKEVAEHFDQELVAAVGRIYAKEVQAFDYEPPF